ncbi:MAG: 1-phosphofructokinase family hexose kinase, partial [Streptosporangiaceae bacterium]
GVRDESRRTLAVVETDGGTATLLNEPGPRIGDEEWHGFVERFRELAGTADAVVLSGSLPPGAPADAYAVLAHEAGDVPVVLDADGETLRQGVAGRPGLVKPNHEELIAATGEDDPLRGAEELRAAGADAVVVSLGAAGLVCCTPEGRWRARLPERVSGNPVGAGDAAVAALVRGLVAGTPWPELLADAAALSSAAVRRPTAGDVDPETYRRLLADVHVQNV